jgi:hypothetical protein
MSSCGIKKQKQMRGGSPASDLVMANLSDLSSPQSVPQGCQLKGDMNSLNLYQPSGGSRSRKSRSRSRSHSKGRKHVHNKDCKTIHRKGSKGRKSGRYSRGASKSRKGIKSKKSLKNNKSNSKNNHHVMKGGSDWISSQYSQGNINAPESTAYNQFSASAPSTRDMLMNPPTLGLAGSGGAMSGLEGSNVRNVGAPLV